MANNFLVHIRDAVSGWVVSQVHVVANDADEAAVKAAAKFGLPMPTGTDPVKLIAQDLGAAEQDIVAPAVKEVTSEAEQAAAPVIEEAKPVLTEAEQVAAQLLKSLPADVLAALKAAE